MPARVVVVGSYNQDMVWRTPRFPVPGETRLGAFDTGPGGKGFNQAIACARQGVATHFIGALGDDALARGMRELALAEGLALHCETHAELATGTAAILVEDSGQNLIVVGPGANAALSVAHITAQAAVIRAARVLVTQHEVNYEASLAAQKIARAAGVLCLHNPAPPVDARDLDLVDGADLITPNETEFVQLLKLRGIEAPAAEALAACGDEALHALCRALPAGTVVVTLGGHGAFVSHAAEALHGDAHPYYRSAPERVQPVDTTGAGDAFSGALAAALASAPEAPFAKAVHAAGQVAALSTERRGAALAIPRQNEVVERFGG
ncbi:ribokinase [Aquimonas voraii]|uniref:Ribokinase n=1 Tax=Aquimonas voraii TaxID=265719 RepID=A0A1G6YKL6_9GAMM|nr:ribokinase [Aquimonas voraii]SDD90106.1 ribokinase [Aquimonas voraii]